MFDTKSKIFSSEVDDFNEYSKKNSLNITLKINLITPLSGTYDYNSLLETLFNKNSLKYDIIFSSARIAAKFADKFEDLNKYSSTDYSNQFHREVYNSCLNEGRLIGLPASADVSVLFSNTKYLNKYKKRIPKTWDELINTTKYIINEERKLNNTELSGYNGLFCDCEEGTGSLYEFIYSFRDSVESEFPELTSKNAIEALEMIKRMKEEISSEIEFKNKNNYSESKIDNGKSLFVKYWYMNFTDMQYMVSPLPGRVENISGGIIGGTNMGINKLINEERKNAAIKAIEFITSKVNLKKYVINTKLYMPIKDLYDDEDVCNSLECEVFKNIQPIARPINKVKDYSDYSEKFRKYAYEYIYENKTAKEVLNNIYDITQIYYLSLSTKDTYIGLIIFIIDIITGVVVILSLSLLYVKKYNRYFKFFTKDLWFMFALSIIFLLIYSLLGIGP
eukprot:jgi/Orpsp1_1/1180855/evm.model.c7180000074881.1